MTLDSPRNIATVMTSTVATIGLAVLLACSPKSAPSTVAAAADDPNVYKALYTDKCSACHNLPDPTINQNTRERWRQIVATMARRADEKGISITDDDETHIVEYLGLFPPKVLPGSNGPLAAKRDDVWDSEPSVALVYTFASPENLSDFHADSGKWAVTGSDLVSQHLTAFPISNRDADLVHKGAALDGGLDLQAHIKFDGATSPGKTAGLLFGVHGPVSTESNSVLVDANRGEVRLVATRGGTDTVVTTAPLGDFDDPSGWHELRLQYRPETKKVTVWIDATKKLTAPLTGYDDGGQFGLVTDSTTTADFRDVYADIYGK